MEWREIAPYAYIALGVTAFCSALGWKYAARYLRWVNRQLGANWIETPAGFRTGGYVGTPWYDVTEQRNAENTWVGAGAEHLEELFFRNMGSLEYWVGRAGTRSMHYLVRGSRHTERFRAEFSVPFDALGMYSSHMEVVLANVSIHIEPESPASATSRQALDAIRQASAAVRRGAVTHCTSTNGVRAHDDGVTVGTPPPEEHTNKPRRLRVRKTK